MDYQGSPSTLANQVQAAADETSGFLHITGYGADPSTAEQVSTAFSHALRQYLEQIKARRADQQQAQLEAQIEAAKAQGASPAELAPLRLGLSQLALERTAPISLTIIQGAKAEPATGQGFKPPKSRAGRALLAAILGLLAGIALALVLERYDTRIRTRDDAEAGFALPVLAEIPDISRRWRKQVVTATHPMSRAADAFRLLSLAISRTSPGSGGSNGNGHPNGNGSTTPERSPAEDDRGHEPRGARRQDDRGREPGRGVRGGRAGACWCSRATCGGPTSIASSACPTNRGWPRPCRPSATRTPTNASTSCRTSACRPSSWSR